VTGLVSAFSFALWALRNPLFVINYLMATTPLGGLLVGLGLLVITFVALYQNSEAFRTSVNSLWSDLQGFTDWIEDKSDIFGIINFSGKTRPGPLLRLLGVKEFATGGYNPFDTLAVVGEHGPELMHVPGGARITPMAGSPVSLPGMGQYGARELLVKIPVFLDSREIAEEMAVVSLDDEARA
jgi:hypothetical protein